MMETHRSVCENGLLYEVDGFEAEVEDSGAAAGRDGDDTDATVLFRASTVCAPAAEVFALRLVRAVDLELEAVVEEVHP
jgi:hypothetical protein